MRLTKFVLTDELAIRFQFEQLEEGGFEWGTPLPLSPDAEWEDGEPQVDSPCPQCKKITARTFNMTRYNNKTLWTLEACDGCGAIVFEEERYG